MIEAGGGPRGRGAVRNVAGRFAARVVEPERSDRPEQPATRLLVDSARTIVTRNDSPDVPFDRSINPYRGCEHGCTYCFARPSHAFLDLSPGLDFETRIFHKPAAPALLRAELARTGYRCEAIALGANTDPYQPAERALGLTRRILEVLAEHRHPVVIVTKSSLVARDLDLLAPMAAERLAAVYLSVTTLDVALARSMEPRASAPHRRIETIAELAQARVPAGILASPMIPGLNDHELEAILAAAARAGATFAGSTLVRLPHEVREVFVEWLERREPGKAAKVLSRLRSMRGGALNDPRFGVRHLGTGPFAELLRRRFEIACRRLGLERTGPRLETAAFRPPASRPERGDRRQGSLFP